MVHQEAASHLQVEGGRNVAEEDEEEEEAAVDIQAVKKQLLESSWCGLLSALGNRTSYKYILKKTVF